MKKNVLFFDIDEVLNGGKERAVVEEYFINETNLSLGEMQAVALKLEEKGLVRFLRNRNNTIDLGNYVSSYLADKLADIIKKYNVIPVGISSWFTKAKIEGRDFEKEMKAISQCLGFEVKEITKSNSGADFRLMTSVEWLKENVKANENVSVVYLDDSLPIYTYEHQKNNLISAFKEFNGAYNGLIVCPRSGINENQFKQIEKWFS